MLNQKKQHIDTGLCGDVVTAQQQKALTPDVVMGILKEGNRDFTHDALTVRNNTKRIREAALRQFPKAAILSCMDSRIPIEDVFHCGLGELFVVRIAGNFVNEDILGSLEYACGVSSAKLIVVLGHEHCGAIKAVIDDVRQGNITMMLNKIRPVLNQVKETFDGDQSSSNPAFVDAVCVSNIRHSVQQIRLRSLLLKEMEERGEIEIVGAVYHMKTGKVEFLSEIG